MRAKSDATATSGVVAARERELKLVCDEATFSREALIDLLAEVGAALSSAELIENVDTYMDTRDRSLARAGLSGRCRRRDGQRKVQLKPEPLLADLLFERTELGARLPRGTDPGRGLKQLIEQSLPLRLRRVPVAEVVVRNRRERWRVSAQPGGGGRACSAELCLDSASVRRPSSAGVEAGRFVELELELKGGDERAFEVLAARIAALPGVEASGASKHRRACEAIGIERHRFGPPTPKFGALATADEVARAVCSAQLAAIRSYEPGTWAGLDPEHLHKMRVATRRLRAALRNFDGCFDRRSSDYLLRNLRWLASELGAVRDLDVHLIDLGRWQQQLGPDPERGWAELRALLRARWDRARARLLGTLGSERYRKLCARAGEVFDGPAPRRPSGHPGAQPVVELARAMVTKRVRQLRRAARRCRREGSPESVHALRIVGKKLRYTTEFFRPLYGDSFRRRTARLSRFQDVLGRFQDSVVAGQLAIDLRDEALASGGSAELLYVVGRLVGWSEANAELAGSQVSAAFSAVGGKRLLRFIERAAEDAVVAAAALLEAEEAAAEAISRAEQEAAAAVTRAETEAAGMVVRVARERAVVSRRTAIRGSGSESE